MLSSMFIFYDIGARMKALRFDGNGSEYFKIWIVNILLTLITLGLYYPWAKVRNRRYFYANSILEDRNFEYHAKGKQLFIGYFIAMLLLIIYVVIESIVPLANLIILPALFIIAPWIILRSMMFNMKMTSFSNVRFKFTGKSIQAYINYFAYPLGLLLISILILVAFSTILSMVGMSKILTVPIIFLSMLVLFTYGNAFLKKKNTEFILSNTQFGQGIFSTKLDIKKLIIILSKALSVGLLVLTVITLLLVAMIGFEQLVKLTEAKQDTEAFRKIIVQMVPIIVPMYLGLILVVIFIKTYLFTKYRNYIYANTKLDEIVNFESTLKFFPYSWVIVSNFIIIVLTLGFAMPWAKVRVARIVLENTWINTDNGLNKYISQNQDKSSALGEQIGEAFDIEIGL